MKKIDKSKMSIIEKAYGNQDFFKSCCVDYLKYNEAKSKQDENIFDLRKHTTTSGNDGVTTGIVCEVDFDKDNKQLYLYLFVEGQFKWTVADEPTCKALLEIEQETRQENKSTVECFDFMLLQPYVLKVVKGVVGMFKALPAVDEKILDIYYRLAAA